MPPNGEAAFDGRDSSAGPPTGARRRFWRVFLPVAVLVAVGTLAAGLLAERSLVAELERPATRIAAQLKTHLDGVLSSYVDQLVSVGRREPRLSRQFNAAEPDLGVVANEFFTLLVRNEEHFQVRWIDENGREVVRLDQDGAGNIRRVPDAELQDKSSRPYVAAGLTLGPAEIYVSALDLNVENGVLSVPHVPTIRLVTRVFGASGAARGIVVLNVGAARFLDRFRAISRSTESFLLNADGYWLSSVHAEDEWGFMLGRQDSFGRRHPGVWAAMQRSEAGRVVSESGFWTWQTPEVLPNSARGDASLQWKIVASSRITAQRVLVWAAVLGGMALLLMFAASSLWRLSLANQGRLLAQQAYRREAELLAEANQSLQRSIEEQEHAEKGLRAAVDKLSAARAETEAARQEAERANRAKSAFLANTSHEIRTPLNAVIGSAYLLGLTKLDGDQRQHVETIDIASRSLLDLINDVLDLSKIEAGEMQLDPVPFAPAALLGELRTMFDVGARHKGLALHFRPLPDAMPGVLVGDVRRLRQILANLINNAIKFTDHGSVTVDASVVEPAGDANAVRVRFRVIDTGIGVPLAVQDRVFSPFVQADVSTSRRFGGTGLGLSIVRHLSEMLGGRAGVESEAGEGSTFWVEVVFARADDAMAEAGPGSAAGPLRVVVADDDAADRQVIAHIARRFDWSVDVVDGGQTLVEHVLEAYESAQRLDCVLVDWRMPEVDGLDAMKQIRTRLWDAPMPGIVMVTAADEAEFRGQDGALLADQLVTKPIDPSSLFNAVNDAAFSHGLALDHVIRRTRIEGVDCQWLYGVRVLVVDDSPMNLDVCQRILEHQGAVVTMCRSGEDALGRLAVVGERYDAVLMDVQMPGMDGCETTCELRKAEGWGSVPIVALTASAIASERERAMAAGMDGFLTKPIDPGALVLALRTHVESVRGKPLPVVPRPSDLPREQASFPEIEGIDRNFAMRRLEGDQVLFFSLLRNFSKEHAHTAERLAGLIAEKDIDAAAAFLHRLRGQAGYLAAGTLFERAQALETALVEGKGDLAPAHTQFEESLRAFLRAIEPWTRASSGRETLDEAAVPIGEVLPLVGELRGLLKSFALSAEACARRIAVMLGDSAWRERFDPIIDLIEWLRYDEALRALAVFEGELKGGKQAGADSLPAAEHP